MINTLMLVSKKKGWIEATKIQQRDAALLLCVALIVSALAGCGGKDGPAEQRPAADTVEYTKLNDSASRQLLERLLSDAGVSEERMEDFFSRVDRFNDSVSAEWLTQGFETAGMTETKYDPYEMQDLWTAKNRAFPGYNCRITAMSLFEEFLSFGEDTDFDAGEDVLFVDEETLKAYPKALGGSSLNDFRALYASMKAEVGRHVRTVQAQWRKRGVSFRDSERIRLILLRFTDRTALSNYLMGKYDISWGQDTARPFIMENDTLMEGWRPCAENKGSVP